MEFGDGIMNSVKLEFVSNLENISFARSAGAAFLHQLNPTISFIQEIKTVISEAVTNAIIHGYQSEADKIVTMELKYDDLYLYIEIKDQGVGIPNLEEAKMPLYTTRANDERSGLGFTIMEVFSDLFDCETEVGIGTTIRLQKKLPIDAEESEVA